MKIFESSKKNNSKKKTNEADLQNEFHECLEESLLVQAVDSDDNIESKVKPKKRKRKKLSSKKFDENLQNESDFEEDSIWIRKINSDECEEIGINEDKDKFKKEKRNCKPSEKKRDWDYLQINIFKEDDNIEEEILENKKRKRKRDDEDFQEFFK
jgi:hypothetical protein